MAEAMVELKKILDFSELKTWFETYRKATGLSVVLHASNGDELLSVRNDNCICNFKTEESLCKSKLVYSGEKAFDLKTPYIFETACGLIMCATALVIDDVFVGFITTGPVILWDKEDFYEEEFLNNCKKVGIDTKHVNFDLSKIKHVDCETMTGQADMLMLMVDYMVEKERRFREIKNEKEEKFLQLKKDVEAMERKVEADKFRKYPVELEKELLAYVHLGDKKNARSIINDLLTEILLYAGGDLNVIKAKLYELMAFFSRTAVEAGAKTTDLSDIVKKSSKLLLDNIDFQDLCRTTIDILDEYLEVVYKTRGEKSAHAHLATAIAYINEEYGDCNLSLNETAKKVFISPYYISHLFRAEMGTTFVDYLTKVRIEHAKTLLLEGASIDYTAEKVGFKDSSYFTKIFKKHVGVTPTRFRKG